MLFNSYDSDSDISSLEPHPLLPLADGQLASDSSFLGTSCLLLTPND